MEGSRATYMIGGEALPARPLEAGLHLVATPIGNLGDVTLRALETLAAADIVACEDTRVTRTLLSRYGIARRTMAYHEHNADTAGPKLVEAIGEGRSVALVSDAGTPLVSDPGFRLVQAAVEAGHKVVPVPGASAVLAGLAASALPTDTFLFAGFLSVKDGQRRSRIRELAQVPATLVFFESPHRLGATLKAMADELGTRDAAVCRELTKRFEEVRRGGLDMLASHYEAGETKGEIVICVGPPPKAEKPDAGDVDALLVELAAEMTVSRAAAEAARRTGEKKQDLYKRLLELRGGNG